MNHSLIRFVRWAGALVGCAGGTLSAALFAEVPSVLAVAPAPSPLGPAPAWHLKDLAGNEVSSDQFKGKVVIVDFWAPWCGPCKEEIPTYVHLQKKYAQDGLVIVGIVYDLEKNADVRKIVDQFKINYPIVLGNDDVVAAFGGMDAIPTTFLIDRSGMIQHRKVGPMPPKYEQLILRYLHPVESVLSSGRIPRDLAPQASTSR